MGDPPFGSFENTTIQIIPFAGVKNEPKSTVLLAHMRMNQSPVPPVHVFGEYKFKRFAKQMQKINSTSPLYSLFKG